MIPAFAYTRATTVNAALEALSQPGTRPIAGGTDLLGCLRDEVVAASHLVSLSRVDALRGIVETADGGLRLGALTTVDAIARDPAVVTKYRALAQAAAAVASPQLRHQGTLGGNLCQRPRCWFLRGGYDCARKGGAACFALQGDNRYHAILGGSGCVIVHPSDTAVALTALGASVSVAGPRGARVVPIERFFVGPDIDLTRETVLERGELLTDVTVPAVPPGTLSVFQKVRARGTWDFALASVAVVARLEKQRLVHARVVLGAAARVPWRATAAAVEGASPLEHNGYKVAMLKGLVEKVLAGLAG